ncbi:MAG: ABC transporter ATP-binding protein [Isosphaeraceae bacterium]|nr:ABC transporter ATP-binding protein [Isosphaeraceae bacterium]
MSPIIEFRSASKWYGNVIGLNNVTLRIDRGVTGLLGPNGAGKSTLLQLATGQLRPSQGEVIVLGRHAWNNPGLNREIGLCPEQDAFYEWMSGRRFVELCARLAGMSPRTARAAAEHALSLVDMLPNADRAVRGYSKGMRQRTKIAQSLVHDPELLFLDEPLTGTDPVARRELIDVIHRIGDSGKSVIVSSHVLHEVEAVTRRIVMLNRGRLIAEGDIRQIRDLIDTHPHRIVLKSSSPRELAARLVRRADVVGVDLRAKDGAILVETLAPDAFYGTLSEIALDRDTPIDEVYSDDDNLESVFKYLVNP